MPPGASASVSAPLPPRGPPLLVDGLPQTLEDQLFGPLAAYLAPLRELRIVWIGVEGESHEAQSALGKETGRWKDWRSVSPAYARRLENACKARLASAG